MKKNECLKLDLCYNINKRKNPSGLIYRNISNNTIRKMMSKWEELYDNNYTTFGNLLIISYNEIINNYEKKKK